MAAAGAARLHTSAKAGWYMESMACAGQKMLYVESRMLKGIVGMCRGSEDTGLLEPQMLASAQCARLATLFQ